MPQSGFQRRPSKEIQEDLENDLGKARSLAGRHSSPLDTPVSDALLVDLNLQIRGLREDLKGVTYLLIEAQRGAMDNAKRVMERAQRPPRGVIPADGETDFGG